MSKPTTRWAASRPARLALAGVLVVVATAMVILEPFPNGAVLVSLTRSHGVDVGDLPAIALYLVAGGIALGGA
jgi:hypothetical protein